VTPRGGFEALVAGIARLAAGVLLHTVAVLPLAVPVALIGMPVFARRGIWPAVILVPLGVFLGLLVVLGSL
jgi:hypothetical protein